MSDHHIKRRPLARQGTASSPRTPATNAVHLPVPVTPGSTALKVTETAHLDATLAALAEIVLDPALDSTGAYRSRRQDVAVLKQTLPQLDTLRRRWAAVDRPLDPDEMATMLFKLCKVLPSASNINIDLRVELLCEDIAELRPTRFALARACRAVRNKCHFLSQPQLCKEIRRAELRARRYRQVLDPDLYDLREQLTADERLLLTAATKDDEEHDFFKRNAARLRGIAQESGLAAPEDEQ